jgi:hypothetical protein
MRITLVALVGALWLTIGGVTTKGRDVGHLVFGAMGVTGFAAFAVVDKTIREIRSDEAREKAWRLKRYEFEREIVRTVEKESLGPGLGAPGTLYTSGGSAFMGHFVVVHGNGQGPLALTHVKSEPGAGLIYLLRDVLEFVPHPKQESPGFPDPPATQLTM